MVSYSLAQIQALALSALLQCEVKEYKEDWRKTPVHREGGRFASSSSNDSKSPEASGFRESINKATQSVMRGAATQLSKQFDKLSEPKQEAIAEILDSSAALLVKKKVRQLVDSEGQATFDRVSEKMQGKGGDVNLGDRVKAAARIAEKELEAAATSPIALAKGILGGLVWPSIIVNNLDQVNDENLAFYKEAAKGAALVGGAAFTYEAVQEINQKAQQKLKERERQQLSEELNQFFLGVKKLEEN